VGSVMFIRARSREGPAPATASLRNSAPARLPASQLAADAPNGGADPDGADEEPGEGPSKPELRGMSKKQRRRLMQELRERERNSRQ
jgi:hypothetical protein